MGCSPGGLQGSGGKKIQIEVPRSWSIYIRWPLEMGGHFYLLRIYLFLVRMMPILVWPSLEEVSGLTVMTRLSLLFSLPDVMTAPSPVWITEVFSPNFPL